VPLNFIFIIMYFVMIRPQKKRQQQQQNLMASLKTGDRVVTIDPSPIAIEILQRNLELNSFSQLHARKIACGAAPCQVRMQPHWHFLLPLSDEASAVDAVNVPIGSSRSDLRRREHTA
jgi:hypothetical protein